MEVPGADDVKLDSLSDAIFRAGQSLAQAAVEALAALAPELNLTEFRALTVLHLHGPVRLIDIAEALEVTPTTATRIADRLTSFGLVQRTRLSRDRRVIHLTIATRGAALVDAVADTRRRYLAGRMTDVSPSALLAATQALLALAADVPTAVPEIA